MCCKNKPKMIPYESYMANLSAMTGLNNPDIGAHLVELFGSEASIMFRLRPDQHPKPLKTNQGILLSGGEPSEETFEDPEDKNGPVGGAFTKTVVAILKGHLAQLQTRNRLSGSARGILGNRKKDPQHPCLYCSSKNADAVFLRKASHGRAEIGETSEDRVLED
ncbi:PREDICTED: metacaspase-9-like [Erythranthe guttata]|uniref:metacaspase-9-like n=1 Tax=Erythranthe guttata TaxID=4155 RepID=UPI00064DC967|nr:PREDICTED: metacaspase-9-like [Erythranthe guttata]|eukprot:XP_012846904.1 PREDICTED: metacaspase-9-like [Erythranthe guttata]